jgi:metal-dependent amidase/aminoacylase/carboxypeptidase family protein
MGMARPEATGLPYASRVTTTDRSGGSVPVMHACGHDMPVTWLVGATTLLAQARDAWKGTVMAVFQPAEVAAADSAVLTMGVLQAGTKENVIPDDALIKLNVRTFDENVRTRVLAAIERIVKAEAEASGAPRPPEIATLDRYTMVSNDPVAAKRVSSCRRITIHASPRSSTRRCRRASRPWSSPRRAG